MAKVINFPIERRVLSPEEEKLRIMEIIRKSTGASMMDYVSPEEESKRRYDLETWFGMPYGTLPEQEVRNGR